MCFDLAKAFNTIDCSLLLDKLKLYGCDAKTVLLFSSYLSNRRFGVKFDGKISREKQLLFGVPQGSVLFTTPSHLELWAFADDTALSLPISLSSDVAAFLSQVTEILK